MDKVEIPYSKDVFILGIIAAGIGTIPYVGITAFIIAIIAMKKFKIANHFFKQDKKNYKNDSIVKMYVGFGLTIIGFLCAAIYATVLPFMILSFTTSLMKFI